LEDAVDIEERKFHLHCQYFRDLGRSIRVSREKGNEKRFRSQEFEKSKKGGFLKGRSSQSSDVGEK